MNLDESLFEFTAQPRKRPTSYKKRVSKKPLSAKIYDALCDLRYEVFANNSFNGYTISKITNKMGKSTFIKNEEDFNKAIDLLNQYDITYKIEKGIGDTKKLTFSLPEEDEDSVYDYFKNETNRDRAVNESKENNINGAFYGNQGRTIRELINYDVDDNGTLHIYLDSQSVADVSDCANMSNKELQNLVDETLENLGYKLDESFNALTKKPNRKKQKGVHFNPNAGDVEKNIAFFNRANTPNTPNSSCDSGECGNAMGESVESKDFQNRCKDILNNEIDWDEVDETGDADFARNQLRSLHTNGAISEEEYDYIVSNWDNLLEDCNHINEEYGPYHYGDGELEDTVLHEISEDLSRGNTVGLVGDSWNGVTYGRWELLVNGDDVENVVETNDMLEWLLTEISYPVGDGHTEYTGLNLIFDENSIGIDSAEALQSNSAYIKDLVSLDIDRETIDKFIKGEIKEINFYVDYRLTFFKDDKSISFEDIIEQAQTADESVNESIKMNKNKKFVLDESLFESVKNESLMQDIHDAHEFIRKLYGQEIYDALDEYVANGHDLSATMFSEEEWNKFVEWAKQNKELVVPEPKNNDFIASLNPGKPKRTPKTKQVKVLQGNYGYGWDDLCEYEMNDKSSKQDLKDYQSNEPGVAHRIIYRRVPVEK